MHRINFDRFLWGNRPVGLLSSALRILREKYMMDQNSRPEPLGTREKWGRGKDWRDKQHRLLLIGLLALSSLWKGS